MLTFIFFLCCALRKKLGLGFFVTVLLIEIIIGLKVRLERKYQICIY